MNTKYQEFEFEFNWTDNTRWMIPEDEVLYQNQFPTADHSIEWALAAIPSDNRQVCIQAGGHCGLWPIRYAQDFEQVFTFEPLIDTYTCLVENINRCGLKNITTYNTALGPKGTTITMQYSKPKGTARSYGAHHVKEVSNGEPVMCIDEIELNGKSVSHIQLDVEGYEVKCLQSGERIIDEFRPTIVIEQRQLKQMEAFGVKNNDATEWLTHRGYFIADKYGNDLLMISK